MDREQTGDRCGRRPLVRARETGPAVQRAEALLLREGVDLDHDPVDLVPELAAPALPGRARLGHLLDRLQPLGVRVRAEPELAEPRERLPLRRRSCVAIHADPVDVDRQRPRGRDRRVELTKRARGRVSRVRRGLAAGGELRLVEAIEAREREVDLAAHLEHVGVPRAVALEQAQRHGLDRAQVPRHVLASQPVAARRSAHVHAVLVDERDGRAVDLRLEHVGDGFVAAEPLSHVLRPFGERLRCRHLLQRAHRRQVLDLAKPVRGRRADALRRGVGRDELRMLVLERLQLVVQRRRTPHRRAPDRRGRGSGRGGARPAAGALRRVQPETIVSASS